MRVPESIEMQGFFWTPDHDEDKVPGTLHVATSGRVELKLFYLFTSGPSSPSRERGDRLVPRFWPTAQEKTIRSRIHGRVGQTGVTLFDCHFLGFKGTLGEGIRHASYGASKVLFNAWYREDEDLTFTRVSVTMEGLHEWLQLSALHDEKDYSRQTTSLTAQLTVTPP